MRVLVACEESQAVTKEFRALGHEAYSCDIIDQSGGHPEWHIMQDVLPLLNGNCTFRTMDGLDHTICGRWDMIIAFPPCTHLAVSGARYFKKKRESGIQLEAIWFFRRLLLADCDRVAIENPINIIGGDYIEKHFPQFSYMPKFSQKIQPYQFGDPVRKATCLWLKGVPDLVPTNIVVPATVKIDQKTKRTSYSGAALYARDEDGKMLRYNDPRTAKIRSKTFPGIARAMAEQWGSIMEEKRNEHI